MSSTVNIVEDEQLITSTKFDKWKEYIFVSCICVIIFSCFCTPIIIYATSGDVTSLTELGIDEIDLDNCTQQAVTSGSNKMSRYDGTCSEYEDDGVCSQSLNLHTNINGTLITMVNSDVQPDDIKQFLDLLNSGVARKECVALVLPFVCQYVYPPCDSDGNPQLVTEEKCVDIRDNVCPNEWMIAMSPVLDLQRLLPNCEDFRGDSSVETIRNATEPLKCHYQFGEFCGICLPLCGKFSQYHVHTKLFGRGLIIFSCVFELIGGIIFLIASIIRRKEMLIYPQVLEVCHVISTMIIATFVLIGYIGGQERMYCSHKTLHLSFLEPSVFARILGFVLQFSFLFLAITWLFYIFHLFMGLAFPFWSAKFFSEGERKVKILCVLEISGALMFSIVFPSIVLSVSGFKLARFPPVFVFPTKELALYTLLLPIGIVLMIGVNLTFLSFWIIHKSKGIFTKEEGKGICNIRFSVPEVKILLILSYLTVFTIMGVTSLTVIAYNADGLINEVFRYSVCNLSGYDPKCEEIRDEFDKHTSPGLIYTTVLMLAFLSWVNLLFVVQFEHIQRVKEWMKTCRVFISSRIFGS